MKRRKTLDFTKKNTTKKNSHYFVLFSVIIVLILGIVSFIILLAKNDFSFDKFLGTRVATDTTTVPVVSESQSDNQQTENQNNTVTNILLLCSDKKSVTFSTIISADVAAGKIYIKPVAPELNIQYDGKSMSLSQLYEQYSIKEVKAGLEAKGISINKYAEITENNFRLLIKKLGSVEIIIDTDLSYTVESIKYSLTAGKQIMSADMLIKYLKYSSTGDDLLKIQASAISTIIKTYFTAENIKRGESFFATVINYFNSDITAFNFNHNFDSIYYFAASNPDISVIV